MNIRELRVKSGLSQKEVAALLRPMYPKCTKMTVCMVEAPANYGVRFLPEAEELLGRAINAAGAVQKPPRPKEYTLRCRVSAELQARVKQLIEAEAAYPTVSSLLNTLVLEWVRQKEAAASAGTEDDGTTNKCNLSIHTDGGEVNETV